MLVKYAFQPWLGIPGKSNHSSLVTREILWDKAGQGEEDEIAHSRNILVVWAVVKTPGKLNGYLSNWSFSPVVKISVGELKLCAHSLTVPPWRWLKPGFPESLLPPFSSVSVYSPVSSVSVYSPVGSSKNVPCPTIKQGIVGSSILAVHCNSESEGRCLYMVLMLRRTLRWNLLTLLELEPQRTETSLQSSKASPNIRWKEKLNVLCLHTPSGTRNSRVTMSSCWHFGLLALTNLKLLNHLELQGGKTNKQKKSWT